VFGVKCRSVGGTQEIFGAEIFIDLKSWPSTKSDKGSDFLMSFHCKLASLATTAKNAAK
jgi:hypothetical protein